MTALEILEKTNWGNIIALGLFALFIARDRTSKFSRKLDVIMDWVKKHVDTVIVLGGICASLIWMNGKFNDVECRFNALEKDIAVIKTVLIMKQIMPTDICHKEKLAKD